MIFFKNFFFKFKHLQEKPLRISKKNFEQRPKGRSPGLYMAFLALKIHSSQMMKRKSCSFQISAKSDQWCQSYGQNKKSHVFMTCLNTVHCNLQTSREDTPTLSQLLTRKARVENPCQSVIAYRLLISHSNLTHRSLITSWSLIWKNVTSWSLIPSGRLLDTGEQ